MNGEQKEVIWIDTLPQVGTQCPNCVAGFLKDNTFTSKKNEKWESVICEACKQKWIKSKEKKSSVSQLERVIVALTTTHKVNQAISNSLKSIEVKLDEIAGLVADKNLKE